MYSLLCVRITLGTFSISCVFQTPGLPFFKFVLHTRLGRHIIPPRLSLEDKSLTRACTVTQWTLLNAAAKERKANICLGCSALLLHLIKFKSEPPGPYLWFSGGTDHCLLCAGVTYLQISTLLLTKNAWGWSPCRKPSTWAPLRIDGRLGVPW